jgi:hypothetical protein
VIPVIIFWFSLKALALSIFNIDEMVESPDMSSRGMSRHCGVVMACVQVSDHVQRMAPRQSGAEKIDLL